MMTMVELTKSQKIMVADGLPSSLLLTQEEREAAWDTNPPRQSTFTPIKKTDPAIEAFAFDQAEQKRLKTQSRIAKMKTKLFAPDPKTHTWDSRGNRFVPLRIFKLEDKMRPDFENMNGTDLVKAHNEMAVVAVGLGIKAEVVKKFRMLAAGIRKCDELYRSVAEKTGAEVPPPLPPTSDDIPSSGEQDEENDMAKKPARANSRSKVKKGAKTRVAKKTAGEPKARTAGGFDPEAKITLITKENPRREGTRAHKIYALYTKCKTVGDFTEKGGAGKDLKWDVDHKNIKVG
jgi:hypothetical protein